MKNVMMSFLVVSFAILALLTFIAGGLLIEKAYKKSEAEAPKETWKVHLYSGGKEIMTYTTVGHIRKHQYNSTISFIEVLSGKEVVISGTFIAEEF